MTITFRNAKREDVPSIVAMLRDDALGKGRELGDISEYLAAFDEVRNDPNNHILLSERDGEIVASCQLTIIPGLSLRATRRMQVEGVRVRSDLRGQGVGEAMFQEIERRAGQAGATLLQLTMNESRTEAHRFYKRIGFEATHVGFKKMLDQFRGW